MNNPEIDKRLHDMLDAHDAVFNAMRRSNALVGQANALNGQALDRLSEAIASLRSAGIVMGAAFDAHDETLKAAMAANRAAIDVLDLMRREPS